MPNLARAAAVLLVAAAAHADAQSSISDSAILARIRDEGFNRSRVFETAVMLSDVYGPRFNAVGIPAFTFIQDFVDYNTRTHHTDKDESAYLLPEDLKQAAVVVATVLYQVANLPELLPRSPLPPPRKE